MKVPARICSPAFPRWSHPRFLWAGPFPTGWTRTSPFPCQLYAPVFYRVARPRAGNL